MSSAFAGSTPHPAGSKILLETARPDLYQRNAFRVTELPVDATAHDFSRRQQMVDMATKTGLAVPAGPSPIFPLEQRDGVQAVRDAMHRLRDPELRLVDEFFWFWPHQLGASRTDDALAALARVDYDQAVGIWHDREDNSSESHVSTHNMAVLRHFMALEWELAAQSRTVGPDVMEQVTVSWVSAFRRWRMLLEHEGFWSRLSARIRDLDDPRLTTGTAPRIRSSLPLALLSINARLAVQAAERGDQKTVQRQLQILRVWEQPDPSKPPLISLSPLATQALQHAAEPIRERIKLLCKTVQSTAEADPVHADQPTQRLLEQARSTLSVVDSVLPEGHSMRVGLHDEVALSILTCQVAYTKKTENWRKAITLLEGALGLAASDSTRQRLKGELDKVRENAESGGDWCGDGYFDLPSPVMAVLETARGHAEGRRWDEAIALLEVLLGGRGGVSVEENDKPLVLKPLAVCHNRRGVARINAAQNNQNDIPAVIRRVANRAGSSGFALAAMMAGLGRNAPSGMSMECMSCGRTIHSQFYRVSFKGISLIICTSCGDELDRERDRKKEELRRVIRDAAEDITLADAIDPQDKAVQRNMKQLRELASDLGVTLPDSRLQRIRSVAATVIELLQTQNNSDPTIRREAAAALTIMGMGAIAPLSSVLKNRDPALRRAALTALGNLGNQAVPSIVPALLDPAVEVRRAAEKALKQVDPNWMRWTGGTDIMATLHKALRDPVAETRRLAVEAMRMMGSSAERELPSLVAALLDPDASVRQAVVAALPQVATDWAQSRAALELLPTLLAGLRVEAPKTRCIAAETLGLLGPEVTAQALPALVPALFDATFEVRMAAAEALRKIAPDWSTRPESVAFVPLLIGGLQQHHASSRQAAAELLGLLGVSAATAVGALTHSLTDENAGVRCSAAAALAKIGPAAHAATPGLLVALSKDPEPAVRAEAAMVLGSLRPSGEEAVRALHQALSDNNADVRMWAAQALGEFGSVAAPAVPGLLAALGDGESDVRQAAAEAMTVIGSAAVPLLIETLSHSDSRIRKAAIEQLTKLGQVTEQVTMALIRALADEIADVRAAAAKALGSLGLDRATQLGQTAIAALLVASVDPDASVRRAADKGLSGVQVPIVCARQALPIVVNSLSHPDANVRLSALALTRAFGSVAQSALAAVIARLLDDEAQVRAQALETLEAVGADWPQSAEAVAALPSFLAMLGHAREDLRLAGIEGLKRIRDIQALEPLATLLRQDDSVRVRVAAAQVLAKFGPAASSSVPGLLGALGDGESDVRQAAAEALTAIGSAAVPLLIEALSHSDSCIRKAAIEQLTKLGQATEQVTMALVRAVADAIADVRATAAKALRRLGVDRTTPAGQSAIAALLTACVDPDASVRQAAGEAVSGLEVPVVCARQALPIVVNSLSHPDANVRLSALALTRAFGSVAQCALAAVIASLLDDEAQVRTQALETLEAIGADWPRSAEAVAALPSFLAMLGHAREDLRLAGIESLRRIRDIRALEPLAALLRQDGSPQVRVAVARALGQLADHRSIRALVEALADSDADVRDIAMEALFRIDPQWGAMPGAAEGLPVLLAAMQDPQISFRISIIQSLGLIRDNRALRSLIIALIDRDGALRQEAAHVLHNNHPSWPETEAALSAIPVLIAGLEGAEIDVWVAACAVFAEIGPAAGAIVPSLLRAMKHRHSGLAQAARDALRRVDPELSRLIERRRLVKRVLIFASWGVALLLVVCGVVFAVRLMK